MCCSNITGTLNAMSLWHMLYVGFQVFTEWLCHLVWPTFKVSISLYVMPQKNIYVYLSSMIRVLCSMGMRSDSVHLAIFCGGILSRGIMSWEDFIRGIMSIQHVTQDINPMFSHLNTFVWHRYVTFLFALKYIYISFFWLDDFNNIYLIFTIGCSEWIISFVGFNTAINFYIMCMYM